MYQLLKNLSPTQQIGALFFTVFGVLLLASVAAFLLSLKEPADETRAQQRRADLRNFEGILRASWLMVLVFWIGWLSGDWIAITLFGLVSFFALREFLTLSPTHSRTVSPREPRSAARRQHTPRSP